MHSAVAVVPLVSACPIPPLSASKGAWHFDADVPLPPRPGRPPRDAERPFIPWQYIPAPTRDANGKRVEHSYFVPGANSSTVSALAVEARRRFDDMLFVTRYFKADPKTGVAGVRIWRTR